jgi:imidazole glycerol-phosphate synthase subunit HisF
MRSTKLRIVPVLTIDKENLVKTYSFSEPRYIGDPVNAARIFNELEVDELVLTDISSDRYQRELNFRLISSVASECFMPLTYGGGVTREDQVEKLLKVGIEKVIINSANYRGDKLSASCIKSFGAQSVIIGVDYRVIGGSDQILYSDSGRSKVEIPFSEYLQKVCDLGPGEIFLNSIDRDGRMEGPDLQTARYVSMSTEMPVTVCGGVRGLDDIRSLEECGVSGVAATSLFVFWGTHRSVLINYPKEIRHIRHYSDE